MEFTSDERNDALKKGNIRWDAFLRHCASCKDKLERQQGNFGNTEMENRKQVDSKENLLSLHCCKGWQKGCKSSKDERKSDEASSLLSFGLKPFWVIPQELCYWSQLLFS